MSDGTIIISKDFYNQLTKDSEFLACLEAAGVDGWDGYEEACGMMDWGDDL